MALHGIVSNPVPEGAVSGMLTTSDGVGVRFARWTPLARRRGTVCLFGGRAEFIEKYFEVITELRQRGFAVATLDWRGQGGSARRLADPRKGHVDSFDEYQRDLEIFIRSVVLPDCPPPIFALGHSMGASILLEAARLGHRWFDRMVLTAPMIDLSELPYFGMARGVARWAVRLGFGQAYVPGGGRRAVTAEPFYDNPVTSDLARFERSAAIVQAAPELALGSPTIGWINAAFDVMHRFADPTYSLALRQPLLIVAAGRDRVVSTMAIEKFSMYLRAGAHLIIPASRHEILMERNAIRSQFWAAFDAFVPGTPALPSAVPYRAV
jgi:lysophospholipase